MKVTLISHTPSAVNLLLFTKATRLNMTPGLMEEISAMSEEQKMRELTTMVKTIKSSWEFLDVIFLIEGVTRATAQQMTRTRNASYAMQSQRVNDARGAQVTNNFKAGSAMHKVFEDAVAASLSSYSVLADSGSPLEDARGILPMNVQCNLVAKYNLRAFSDLIKARKSMRAQGEYNSIALAMEQEVLRTWPWSAPFFISDKQIAIDMLEGIAKEVGVTTGKGIGWEIAKAVDLIRKD